MSHVIVVNSNAKTVRIPTTPVKYLTEVRDEACQKFGLNKDQFTLKLNNKPISLSQQIRFANLAQGARLELVQASRSPTVISVALQLPESERPARLTEKFASNTSLWEILRRFESGPGANYNFTQRGIPEMSGTSGAGRLHYEMPVVTVMPGHAQQSTFVGLQKTLSQLGFDKGSALLKLSFKNSGQPLEEAMSQISQYFKSEDSATGPAHGAHAASSSQLTSDPGLDQAAPEASSTVAGTSIRNEEPEPDAMDEDTAATSLPATTPNQVTEGNATEDTINTSPTAALNTATSTATNPSVSEAQSPSTGQTGGPTRNVQIFAAPTSSTPQAARNAFNENDYLPSIEHAKAHQASLQNRTRNQRLLSDKELEEQDKARQEKLDAAAEKGGALRIRMPDGTLIQMIFSKADTAEILYGFVQGFLDRKNEPFELKYTASTGRLALIRRDHKRLIQDLRFATNELITFQWAENASAEARASRKALAHEWQAKAQTLKVEEPAAAESSKPTVQGQTVGEGKRKAGMSSDDKESKLKSILGKGLFKKK